MRGDRAESGRQQAGRSGTTPDRIGCAVLGATGAVGQRFVERLADHPTFEIRSLVGSERSAGRSYQSATHWILDRPVPHAMATRHVEDIDSMRARDDVDVVFSALPAAQAQEVERPLCRDGFSVFTNASTHRMDPDVPLLIPEVNPEHLALLDRQPGPGHLVANGNCSAIILTLALAPLHREFGIRHVDVTTMQGLSGAGYPGVSGLDILDNVVPLIPGEEEKLETEPQKTLGDAGTPAGFSIAATCTRVPVREGHFESVHVELESPASVQQVRAALDGFAGLAGLPSAPVRPIIVHDEPDRPQPRRDRDASGGMAVSVGRIRCDGRFLRFIVLGHNTVRGAAGQSVLNAEFAARVGRL